MYYFVNQLKKCSQIFFPGFVKPEFKTLEKMRSTSKVSKIKNFPNFCRKESIMSNSSNEKEGFGNETFMK